MAEALRVVSFDDGTAAELLVSAAAMADPRWRPVFAGAAADRRLCPPVLRRDVERIGRFGFLNLLGKAPGRTTQGLLAGLRREDPVQLQLRLVGWQRGQLRELLTKDQVLDALTSRPAALTEVLRSGRTVLSVTPWLLRTPAAEVQRTLLATLTAWRDLRYPRAVEKRLRADHASSAAALASRHDPRHPLRSLEEAADGLRYDPPGEPRKIWLCPAPSAAPIVVVVDDVAHHVVCAAPAAPESARQRLLVMTAALGDETRLRLLDLLREQERSATDLSAAMGVPRTSLLHHLAQLRAAGLVTTTVTAGRTVYRFRDDAADVLAAAMKETYG